MDNTQKLINLTPHAIHIHHTIEDLLGTSHPMNTYPDYFLPETVETVLTVEPSGTVCRVVAPPPAATDNILGHIPTAIYSSLAEGGLEGLPAPEEGTVYIVSVLCLDAAARLGRHDVMAPDTSHGAVRDEGGRLIGTRRLLRALPPKV